MPADGAARLTRMAVPVVLVHGFGTSFDLTWVSNGWVDLLGDEGRQVVGVDLLGHGAAPKPHDVDAYDDLGARVVEALPGDGKVDAIGFSLGAKTLLKVVAAHPDRFRSLIVAGVGANLFRSDDMSAVVDAVRNGDDGGNPVLGYFSGLAQLPGNDREALAACMANGGGRVGAEELAAVGCPVLVVLGEHDFIAPAGQLVEALPDARLVTLPRPNRSSSSTQRWPFSPPRIEV